MAQYLQEENRMKVRIKLLFCSLTPPKGHMTISGMALLIYPVQKYVKTFKQTSHSQNLRALCFVIHRVWISSGPQPARTLSSQLL